MTKVCEIIQETDINSSGLITHQGNSYQIHFYTNHGSSELNMTVISKYPPIINSLRIKLIRDFILPCPLLEKEFGFYRLFTGETFNRKHIIDIKIGEVITFNRSLSCIREITTDSDKFENMSFKILCKHKDISYYLFIEMFSDYPQGKEVLLISYSYVKILSIDDFYYATKLKNPLYRNIFMKYIQCDLVIFISLLYHLIMNKF